MNILIKLNRVLDEEKRCLLDGDYEKLERLLGIKTEIAQQISNMKPSFDQNRLTTISLKAKNNEMLFDSAQRGIKSAMSHLKEASEGSFKMYSREGSRTALSKPLNLRQKV